VQRDEREDEPREPDGDAAPPPGDEERRREPSGGTAERTTRYCSRWLGTWASEK
jgi:hypothetical protein